MATTFYFTLIHGIVCRAYLNSWDSASLTICIAWVCTFQNIALIYSFGEVSGALYNPAITFSFWVIGKISGAKCLSYIAVQLLGSIASMCIVFCTVYNPTQELYDYVAVTPAYTDTPSLVRIACGEFVTTFFFTYMVLVILGEEAYAQEKADNQVRAYSDLANGYTLFTTNSHHRVTFAAFMMGFTIGAITLFGGESGSQFNPSRIFGPAVFANSWDYCYLYYLPELAGGALGALLGQRMHDHRGMMSSILEVEPSSPASPGSRASDRWTAGGVEEGGGGHKVVSAGDALPPHMSKRLAAASSQRVSWKE